MSEQIDHPMPSPIEPPVVERRLPWWRTRARLILVPLDGSEEAKRAVSMARVVAQIARATVEVVHVTDEVLSPEELLERVGLRPEETSGMIVEQVRGEPSEAIVRVAELRRAMLIAMTTEGHTFRTGRRLHPVVDTVLQRTPCPVLVLRPDTEGEVLSLSEPRRILLPLDGTPSTAGSLGPALDLAESTQAEVDIVYVATQAEPSHERGSLSAPMYIDQAQYEYEDWAQEFADRFGSALGQFKPTVNIRVHLKSGDPPTEILSFARERQSDILVLQWQAPDHGEVVRRVLADTPCPVLLLPPLLAADSR